MALGFFYAFGIGYKKRHPSTVEHSKLLLLKDSSALVLRFSRRSAPKLDHKSNELN